MFERQRLDPAFEGYAPQAEIVRERTEILDILQRLVLNRLFVTVNLPDSSIPYNSTILEVDHRKGSFILDELYPEDGHRRLLERRALKLRARLRGAEVGFASEIQASGEAGGIAYYRVVAPESLRYLQRRRAFRVVADDLVDVPVRLKLEGRERPLTVKLHDISTGGLSFWLTPGNGTCLSPLQQIPLCEVRVPGTTPLLAALEVRNVRFDDVCREQIVGARFASSDPHVQKRIGRIVAAFQRQVLRRRHRRA